jgi:hypothetical protein
MNSRVDAFAELKDAPVFEPKSKPEARVTKDAVDRVAEETRFVSRQAPKSIPRRKPRVHRTGRNVNFTIKVTTATLERFYKHADARSITLGALLDLALDALDEDASAKF